MTSDSAQPRHDTLLRSALCCFTDKLLLCIDLGLLNGDDLLVLDVDYCPLKKTVLPLHQRNKVSLPHPSHDDALLWSALCYFSDKLLCWWPPVASCRCHAGFRMSITIQTIKQNTSRHHATHRMLVKKVVQEVGKWIVEWITLWIKGFHVVLFMVDGIV